MTKYRGRKLFSKNFDTSYMGKKILNIDAEQRKPISCIDLFPEFQATCTDIILILEHDVCFEI